MSLGEATRMTEPRAIGRGDLAASLVLVFPLFLAYQVGVLFAGNVNGADVVTRAVYGAVGRSAYLLANAGLAIGFLIWLRRGHRGNTLRLKVVSLVVIEAAIYALALCALVAVVQNRVLGLGITASSIVNAAGAGVHEELAFRLVLLGGLVAILSRLTSDHRVAVAFALVASAVAFSAAHHLGIHGEPFTSRAFAFRCVAGLVFGLVFWFRSLAHAVYAHAFYDVLVYWRFGS